MRETSPNAICPGTQPFVRDQSVAKVQATERVQPGEGLDPGIIEYGVAEIEGFKLLERRKVGRFHMALREPKFLQFGEAT